MKNNDLADNNRAQSIKQNTKFPENAHLPGDSWVNPCAIFVQLSVPDILTIAKTDS
ncbi:hypothetical protein PPMP20_15245 [Paraburkholderia phymatum]|uniref:hypothetical protein n=1 Tax=Paraburkholderia phymatum TaxID=148447 RepID=UPI0012FE1CAD|nr:hypothetical protein [Paraburkholderia phymatum]